MSPQARRPHVRARASTTMALLENFKREDAQYAGCKLPDPQGALAKEVPPSAASDSRQQRQKDRRLSGSLAHTSSSPINAILVHMVATDHCFNLESRHLLVSEPDSRCAEGESGQLPIQDSKVGIRCSQNYYGKLEQVLYGQLARLSFRAARVWFRD